MTPVAGARVELWRDRSFLPDEKITRRYTGSDGSYDIWQGAHNAYADYRTVVGATPPQGAYKIDADFPCCGTPFTTTDVTRWPSGYKTGDRTPSPNRRGQQAQPGKSRSAPAAVWASATRDDH